MKKMYALIVCMTVCGAALFAQTAADFETKADGDGVVIAKYKGADGDVVIPATIGGKAVVGIGKEAFPSNESLASVTIPEGVTTIDELAFAFCSSLTSVTLPDSVTSIDMGAFFGCSGLTSITIPAGVTSIGPWAFSNCIGLTSVTIPDSVTSIYLLAFSGCDNLKPEVRADIEKRFGKSVFQ
jgi:hypothetical protein